MATRTDEQYNAVLTECHDIFSKKLRDYGAAWRIMRPESVTDQIFIKASRIRTLETTGNAMVDEGIRSELIGIINYAIIALIQLSKGAASTDDITLDEAETLYTSYAAQAHKLMQAKNHDYGEAWRQMRTQSYTDLILMKIHRTKQIENNGGHTLISEGIDANYFDMINYAIFYMIQNSEK